MRYAGAGRGGSVQLARRAPAEQRQFVECRAPPRLEHRQRGAGPLAQGQQPASLQLAGKAGGELAFAQRQARVEQTDRSALYLCPSRQGAGADVGEGGLAGHADPEQVARRLRRFGIRLRRGDAGADFAPQVQLVGQVEAGGVFPLAAYVLVGGFGEGLVVAVAPILVAIADLGPWPAFALCAAQMAEERAGMGIGCGQVAVVAQRGGHQVVQPRVLVERPPLGGQRVAAGSRHPRQARVEAFRAWRGLVAVRAAQRGGDPQRQRHATQMTGKRHCPAPVSERAGNGKAGAGGLRRQKRQSSSRNGQSADFSALSHQVRAAAQGQQPGRDGQQGDAGDLPGVAVHPGKAVGLGGGLPAKPRSRLSARLRSRRNSTATTPSQNATANRRRDNGNGCMARSR
ncbi:hypothetical protein X778_21865 [Pseudomonas aeruginosa VRFPA07]|nr:hypothetical protein X778_21865 [Pseudomonas aeruginosa VRFPA07]